MGWVRETTGIDLTGEGTVLGHIADVVENNVVPVVAAVALVATAVFAPELLPAFMTTAEGAAAAGAAGAAELGTAEAAPFLFNAAADSAAASQALGLTAADVAGVGSAATAATGATLGSIVSNPAAALAQQLGIPEVAGKALIATATSGGDVEKAAKNMALQYGTQYISGQATALANTALSELPTDTLSPETAKFLAKEAGSGITAAVTGGNPLLAMANTGISQGVNAITSQIPGYTDMPAWLKSQVNAAITPRLNTGNTAAALAAGLAASKNTTQTPATTPAATPAVDNTLLDFTARAGQAQAGNTANIAYYDDPFGSEILPTTKPTTTKRDALKSPYGDTSSIFAAEGGSIDDLMEYLRK